MTLQSARSYRVLGSGTDRSGSTGEESWRTAVLADPTGTGLGRVLRRSHLDELPQRAIVGGGGRCACRLLVGVINVFTATLAMKYGLIKGGGGVGWNLSRVGSTQPHGAATALLSQAQYRRQHFPVKRLPAHGLDRVPAQNDHIGSCRARSTSEDR